jgi:hypothetical protein
MYFSFLSLFWKVKIGLWFLKNKNKLLRSSCYLCLCVCLYVFVCPPYQLLNAWISLYETWYVYHDIRAHLNGVLYKSLPSVCVSIPLSFLGNGSVNTFPRQRRIIRGVVFSEVRVISEESRRLVFPELTVYMFTKQVYPCLHSLPDYCMFSARCARNACTACISVRMFQLENRCMNFDEIWYGRYIIGSYLKLVLFKFPSISDINATETRTCEVGA